MRRVFLLGGLALWFASCSSGEVNNVGTTTDSSVNTVPTYGANRPGSGAEKMDAADSGMGTGTGTGTGTTNGNTGANGQGTGTGTGTDTSGRGMQQ